MRYFVQFQYVGTAFHGSQTQPNGITVQQVMEQAFATIMRHPVALTFAGRTDAGVHAEQMVAHWDEEVPFDARELVSRLNNLLPDSIAVQRIYPVSPTAHARFDAKARTYEYRIVDHKTPFLTGLTARVAPGLDFEAMNQAASFLLGKHDFASFCKVHTDVKTTYCDIRQAHWDYHPENGTYVFTIQADRFLRNMVRAVVGTLLEVGKHKIEPRAMQTILSAHNRCAAGQSAPAEGLFLTQIDY